MLELRGIKKSFGGVKALRGVDFAVGAGEIVGLVGGNGAGKSTLMKIAAGAYLPDEGVIDMGGRSPTSPADAIALGVSLVRQELIQATDLDVGANVMLGHEPHRYGVIDRGALYRRASTVLERVGGGIDPRTPLGDLSPGQKQRVEIARALSLNAKILLLDEPTATLTENDAARLFDLLRELRKQGLGMVYISHRLAEVLEITDRIVCLRDGQKVAEVSTKQATRESLVEFLAGAGGVYSTDAEPLPPPATDVVMEVRGRVSFDLHAGEILGLAGLVGAGRTELARVLFGLTPADAGTIAVGGRVRPIRTPTDAVALGLAYVPEDRRQHGVIAAMSVAANTSLASLGRLARYGLLDRAAERTEAQRFVANFAIRTPSIDAAVGTLSGGNQQKVALARWLSTSPRVLILDEPTQGVDIGAKAEIHRLIRALAADGLAILLISSELTELLGLAHRIGVMRGGRLVGMLPHDEATEERLMALALGHTPMPVPAAQPGGEARPA
jgi:ABC-type sugar transport system ATPase subunit